MVVTKRRLAAGAALLIGAGLAVAGPVSVASAHERGGDGDRDRDRVVSAYFADWDIYGRGYEVKNIPADKLNVIQYAFGVPTFDKATGTVGCATLDQWADFERPVDAATSVDGKGDDSTDPNQHLFGNFNQLRKLKAAHPGLKVEISLGGWTKSTWFADVAATPQRRTAFVSACLDQFIKGNLTPPPPALHWPTQSGGPGAAAGLFDGIDVDWEYPTQLAGGNVDFGPADRHNATLLLAEFRKQLDALGGTDHKHYLLTAALPAARSSTNYYELAQASRYLDWDNVMAFDYNVPGGTTAAPDTLFLPDPRDPNAKDWTWNTVGTIAWYLRNGVPVSKIVVGVPFYGNQYIRSGGLYQKFDNTGLDPNSLAWDQMPQPTYHSLVDQAGIVNADGTTGSAGYSAGWDRWAGEPYLTNPAGTHALASGSVTVPTVIGYSSPRSIRERTDLVRAWGLRGVMAWEISQDSDAHALTGVLGSLLN